MLCLWVGWHLLQLHGGANSSGLDGLLDDVPASQVTHEVYKVGGLLYNAAAALLCVPPLCLLYVVVGAGVATHN